MSLQKAVPNLPVRCRGKNNGWPIVHSEVKEVCKANPKAEWSGFIWQSLGFNITTSDTHRPTLSHCHYTLHIGIGRKFDAGVGFEFGAHFSSALFIYLHIIHPGVGLRPLAFRGCGSESRGGHGCLSLVSVSCCQVEVSAKGWGVPLSVVCGLWRKTSVTEKKHRNS